MINFLFDGCTSLFSAGSTYNKLNPGEVGASSIVSQRINASRATGAILIATSSPALAVCPIEDAV